MFVIFLPVVRFLTDICCFDSPEPQLPSSGKTSVTAPCNPREWGLTIIEPCPQGHSDWPMVEHMTQPGPITVLPWDLFLPWGKKEKKLGKKSVLFLFLFFVFVFLSACGVSCQLRCTVLPKATSPPPPLKEPSSNRRKWSQLKERNRMTGESLDLSHPQFQELKSQELPVSWAPKA